MSSSDGTAGGEQAQSLQSDRRHRTSPRRRGWSCRVCWAPHSSPPLWLAMQEERIMNFRRKVQLPLAALLMACLFITTAYGQRMAAPASDSDSRQEAPDGRYIVQFHQYGPGAAAEVRSRGGRIALELPKRSAMAVYLPAGAAKALAAN